MIVHSSPIFLQEVYGPVLISVQASRNAAGPVVTGGSGTASPAVRDLGLFLHGLYCALLLMRMVLQDADNWEKAVLACRRIWMARCSYPAFPQLSVSYRIILSLCKKGWFAAR